MSTLEMVYAKNVKVGDIILRRVTDYSFEEEVVKRILIDESTDTVEISFTEGSRTQLRCGLNSVLIRG
jgi:hypothetical protein